MPIGINNQDVMQYTQLLKGNMSKGPGNLRNIMHNPITAEEFLSNMGALQTVFGSFDENTSDLLDVLEGFGYLARAMLNWANFVLNTSFTDINDLFIDDNVLEKLETNPQLQTAFLTSLCRGDIGLTEHSFSTSGSGSIAVYSSTKDFFLLRRDSDNPAIGALRGNSKEMLEVENIPAGLSGAYNPLANGDFYVAAGPEIWYLAAGGTSLVQVPGAYTGYSYLAADDAFILYHLAEKKVVRIKFGVLETINITAVGTQAITSVKVNSLGSIIIVLQSSPQRVLVCPSDATVATVISGPLTGVNWNAFINNNDEVLVYPELSDSLVCYKYDISSGVSTSISLHTPARRYNGFVDLENNFVLLTFQPNVSAPISTFIIKSGTNIAVSSISINLSDNVRTGTLSVYQLTDGTAVLQNTAGQFQYYTLYNPQDGVTTQTLAISSNGASISVYQGPSNARGGLIIRVVSSNNIVSYYVYWMGQRISPPSMILTARGINSYQFNPVILGSDNEAILWLNVADAYIDPATSTAGTNPRPLLGRLPNGASSGNSNGLFFWGISNYRETIEVVPRGQRRVIRVKPYKKSSYLYGFMATNSKNFTIFTRGPSLARGIMRLKFGRDQ